MNITVSAYNRPEYLHRTLDALSRCDGIEDCRVAVMFDPCETTHKQGDMARGYGFTPFTFSSHAGCNTAIQAAIQYGFDHMGSEFHVHFEDDTVPTRDCLRWLTWAGERYRHDPAVMSVSAYQRHSNGQVNECGLRRWFTPWGWGVWRDRWDGISAGWTRSREVSWDIVVNHVLRAGRYEAFPTVSRVQNIGAENGVHVPSAEWHHANHRVPETADDLFGEAVCWTQTRVDDAADHA